MSLLNLQDRNRFLDIVGASSRSFLRSAFASGLPSKLTADGLVEHVRLTAISHISAPGVYRHLTRWKRILSALEQDPTGARAFAAAMLTGGTR